MHNSEESSRRHLAVQTAFLLLDKMIPWLNGFQPRRDLFLLLIRQTLASYASKNDFAKSAYTRRKRLNRPWVLLKNTLFHIKPVHLRKLPIVIKHVPVCADAVFHMLFLYAFALLFVVATIRSIYNKSFVCSFLADRAAPNQQNRAQHFVSRGNDGGKVAVYGGGGLLTSDRSFTWDSSSGTLSVPRLRAAEANFHFVLNPTKHAA